MHGGGEKKKLLITIRITDHYYFINFFNVIYAWFMASAMVYWMLHTAG
jgi:hypothetical protein